VQAKPKPGNYYSKLAASKYNRPDSDDSSSSSNSSSSSSSSDDNPPRFDSNKITRGEESSSYDEDDSSDDASYDEGEMQMAIRRSLGIAAPIPAKKIAYRKTAEDTKPAAKKVNDTKKPTSKPKVTVDTLYGNKMLTGQVSIKQDRVTGKINLSQEFDKEAEQQTPKSKDPKPRQDNHGKKESTAPSGPSGGSQPTESTKTVNTENNKTADTNVLDPKEPKAPKDATSGEVFSSQGKTEGSLPLYQPTQSNPDLPSNKKMTPQEWGAKFVHKHQERAAKRAKAQQLTHPESLKERLIRERKSHPDPKDPKFHQYFKDKAIKPTHCNGEGL
jgi:hypothetical protein